MSAFIASRIMLEADKSLAEGQEKYRQYFVYTTLYLDWQAEVDTILQTEGYSQAIVNS